MMALGWDRVGRGGKERDQDACGHPTPPGTCHRLPALGSSLPHKSQKPTDRVLCPSRCSPGLGASVLEAEPLAARRPTGPGPRRPEETRLLRAQPRSARPRARTLPRSPAGRGGLHASAPLPRCSGCATVVAVVPQVTEGGGLPCPRRNSGVGATPPHAVTSRRLRSSRPGVPGEPAAAGSSRPSGSQDALSAPRSVPALPPRTLRSLGPRPTSSASLLPVRHQWRRWVPTAGGTPSRPADAASAEQRVRGPRAPKHTGLFTVQSAPARYKETVNLHFK